MEIKNEYKSLNNGVTLIILIVIIILLLILTGLILNILFSSNGTINSVEKTKNNENISALYNAILIETLSYKNGKKLNEEGSTDINILWEKLENEGIIENVETDVIGPDANGIYNITTTKGYLFEIITDYKNNIWVNYLGEGGNLPLKLVIRKVTTNSIDVEVINKEGENYTYFYKIKGGTYDSGVNKTTNSYTYTNLTENTTYILKAEIIKNGKTFSIEQEIVLNKLIAPTTIIKGITWVNGKATVRIGVTETLNQIQYQVEKEGWTTLPVGTTEFTVTEVDYGKTIYIRSYDTTQGGINYSSVDIEDNTTPTVIVTLGTVTKNSITVNVNAIDNETQMPNNPIYNYYIKSETDNNYPSNPTESNTITSYTFTELLQNTIYNIKITAQDMAGNTGEGTITGTTIE